MARKINSWEEYQRRERREKSLERNKKRRDWERKNAGKSYEQIKWEEMNRKFGNWLFSTLLGFGAWLLLFTIEMSLAIAVGVIVGIFSGIFGTFKDTWRGK